jgi:hypothetical protein
VHEPARTGERDPAAETQPVQAAAGPAPGPLQRLLTLQQSAGNAAVSRWLVARDTKPAAPPQPRVSYVFLMGDVKNDAFYTAAQAYFKHMVKGAILVTDKRTLDDVISHVNGEGKPVDTLFIVSHANESGNLGFSLDAADVEKDKAAPDHKPRIEHKELKEANEAGTLTKADTKLIDAQTKIQIKGCNIGRSQSTLDELDEAFGGEASVTAPTHTQEYRIRGGKGAATYEENMNELFVEEPGLVDKDASALAAAFKAKYKMVPEDKWKGLLKKVKKERSDKALFTHRQSNPPEPNAKAVFARMETGKLFPKSAGWVVTFQGRTRQGDDFRYDIEAERVLKDGSTEFKTHFLTVPVPPDDATLIAQEKAKHGRPDAYKWRVQRTVEGSKLKLEVIPERTEWVIEGTIEDASGPFHPAQSDKDWYRTSTFAPPPPAKPNATP